MSNQPDQPLVPCRDTELVLAELGSARRREKRPQLDPAEWTVGDVVAAGAEVGLPLALSSNGQWWIATPIPVPLA